jgi:hypothetical protein
LLTVIGLSHAEDVAHRATGGVADNYQATGKHAIADDTALNVLLAQILDLDRDALKTTVASSKSRPRSMSVRARLAGS